MGDESMKRPDSDWFESPGVAQQLKLEKTSILRLEAGDVLLCFLSEDYPERMQSFQRAIKNFLDDLGIEDVIPIVVPNDINFGVLRFGPEMAKRMAQYNQKQADDEVRARIMEQAARAPSASAWEKCPTCIGTGLGGAGTDCGACHGSGIVQK